MSVDYKSTVFLPKTDFSMRAGLPQMEPTLIDRWNRIDVYRRMRESGAGKKTFILHDGPPYANGHLHIGHALNKILKDVIVRSRQMLGEDSNYVPGWDCHGLPIEWKIEERYREKGLDKDKVDIVEFRRECRDFAEHWIGVQAAEFRRLGVVGDWADPYTTMAYPAEAAIVAELGKFLMNGGLYKGAKPVMWSVVEKTALAEAEVEYHDHTSTTIYVKFPMAEPGPALPPEARGAAIVIWTTTPWTIPGNRAVAYGQEIDYVALKVETVAEKSGAAPGETIIVAEALIHDVVTPAGIETYDIVARFKGSALAGTVCRHPFAEVHEHYRFPVRALPGDFVEAGAGTGFVHIAPGHGQDDWELGVKHGVPVPETVGDDGVFLPHVGLFAGHVVMTLGAKGKIEWPANIEVIKQLAWAGRLLAKGKVVHSYPHSWRSKAPVIFRTTPQWFISMDVNDLRAKALNAIDDTRFVPAQGRNRIRAMVEGRPDWCVSRQRAWGVPITVFVHKKTGEPLRDQAVMDRIVAAVRAEGCDAWFTSPPERFLGEAHAAADYDQVMDILDVWFDSGSTHSFVLEGRDDLSWPAALYLEGSDQHRGWFQSSLLESCGTRGRAPYDAVLTHGFVLDEDGRKMSKSLGNVVSPQEVVEEFGADILRLWVVASDYSEDLRVGPNIIKQEVDVYRRLRNTLRYLLGALDGFTDAEKLPIAEMPELERWVLHRLSELDVQVRARCDDFQFHRLFDELHNFCAVDLSAFYFDVRKDALYCDTPDSPRRRAARTVMDLLFNALVKWLAPFICFTAEEAWLARDPASQDSVHLQTFPVIPAAWRDDALAAKWTEIRRLRRVVTGALELKRAEKVIGASLQAAPTVFAPAEMIATTAGVDMAEVCITSAITLLADTPPDGAYAIEDVPGVGVVFAPAEGEKCERCWKILPDVGTHIHGGVCGRCSDAVVEFLSP